MTPRIITVERLQAVTSCSYYLNGLSSRKKACDFCAAAWDCDHLDRAMPYILASGDKGKGRESIVIE